MTRRTDREPRRFSAHETDRLRRLDGLPLASFRRRAVAIAIDYAGFLFILLPLAIALLVPRHELRPILRGEKGIVIHLMEEDAHAAPKEEPAGEPADGRTIHVFIASGPAHLVFKMLLPILYFGLQFWVFDGRTFGKRLMGLRVVSLAHERLGPWHAIERSLGYAVSALEFGFGYLQYFIHPNRQTTHDRLAETIVVDVRRARREAARA